MTWTGDRGTGTSHYRAYARDHQISAEGKGAIKIYIDNVLADGDVSAKKSNSYYFKIGVYSREGSDRSEVKVRNLRYWIKAPTTAP